jgi:catechol 2,3-dioxygenase-like lactoylglutathione lyase family enzyme
MQKIKGLSHITFICKDIEKSAHMFKHIFDADKVYSSGNKTFSISKEIFLNIGGIWVAIMEGESIEKTYNHVAFQVNETDLVIFKEKIHSLGLTILPGRKRERAEGHSLYFYDYDNHLFELHTGNLADRLTYYHEA